VNEALDFLKAKDERLASIIERTTMETIRWSGDIFEDLVSCILDMQIRYRGKAVKFNKMKEALNGATINQNSIYLLENEKLKSIKMSSQKYNALMCLSTYWQANNLAFLDWNELEDDVIRSLLNEIKGIGNWTIDMILLFTLQRSDVFPIDDLQLKKAMRQVYEIDENENLKKEMEYIADGWKPYRSTAVLYLLENAKNSIK
jgi:DNA-3-methyladenine glycosylase II